MKKENKIKSNYNILKNVFIILFFFFTLFSFSNKVEALTAFPSTVIQDSNKCLVITTSGGNEYINAPATWGDDDYTVASWGINGTTCTTGHTHTLGTISDGEYYFYSTTHELTVWVNNGIFTFTDPNGTGEGTTSTTTERSYVDSTMGNIVGLGQLKTYFGIIIWFLIPLIFRRYIF